MIWCLILYCDYTHALFLFFPFILEYHGSLSQFIRLCENHDGTESSLRRIVSHCRELLLLAPDSLFYICVSRFGWDGSKFALATFDGFDLALDLQELLHSSVTVNLKVETTSSHQATESSMSFTLGDDVDNEHLPDEFNPLLVERHSSSLMSKQRVISPQHAWHDSDLYVVFVWWDFFSSSTSCFLVIFSFFLSTFTMIIYCDYFFFLLLEFEFRAPL